MPTDSSFNNIQYNLQRLFQHILWFLLLALLLVSMAACTRAETGEIRGLERFEDLSTQHVSGPVSYPQTPPVGGPHSPLWQNCGIYDEPIPNEQAVHSLEHGAVWITYLPTLAADEIDRLRQLAREQSHLLLSPYPDLPAPIVASAWGVQLKLDRADDARLSRFIGDFVNNPAAPEPGAPCNNSVGEPILE